MLIFKELIYNGVRSGEIPARTKSSREWYRETARQSFSEIQPGESSDKFRPGNVVKQFSEKRRVSRPELGMMYSFKYDPKHKKTLPYYDTFPLIFPVEQYNDGILGAAAFAFWNGNLNHANLPLRSLPGYDWVFATAPQHHAHHSLEMRQSNSNYGCNIILWDRLFGTYCGDETVGRIGAGKGVPLSIGQQLALAFYSNKKLTDL